MTAHQKDEGRTPDLVGELRELAKSCGYEHGTPTGMAAWKAATEIERLRAKLAAAERLADGLSDEVQFMRNAAKESRTRAEAAEKDMAGVYAWLREPDWNDEFSLNDWLRRKPSPASFRAAAKWMEKIAGPDDMRAPLGARFSIDHDGFVGTVIGYYRRHDGKRGVVLQQDGTKVVHVYGEKWLKAEKNR